MTESIHARSLRRRDEARSRLPEAMLAVRLEEAHVEVNEQGKVRYYLHPDLPNRCINSTLVYRYEIPPHSATGKQLVQGNVAGYVVSGYGRTVVNDVSHTWEAGDVLGLPPLRDGLTVQHFNDSDEEAVVLFAEPNFIDAFGIDMGSGFEQLEPHPAEGYNP